MKLSELHQLFLAYDNASWSPSRMSVKFGCDCGCGGDNYTAESWDAEEKEAEEAIAKMKEFCKEFGIEYDGIE